MSDEVFLEDYLACKCSTKVAALVEVQEFCFQLLLHVQTVDHFLIFLEFIDQLNSRICLYLFFCSWRRVLFFYFVWIGPLLDSSEVKNNFAH